MIRKIPNLGKEVSPRVAAEVKDAFDNLYDLIGLLESKLGISLEVNKAATPSSLAVRTQATPPKVSVPAAIERIERTLATNDRPDPLIEQAISKDTLKSDLVKVVGAVPVGGKITLFDQEGNSIEVLTP